jgi:imidazolonepropionase-like amidohydrolase
MAPGPAEQFNSRKESDRFVQETPPILIKNAKIYTGNFNMTEVVHGDILLDKGLIKAVGQVGVQFKDALGEEIVVIDAEGAWVTPGIVDMHSHLGGRAFGRVHDLFLKYLTIRCLIACTEGCGR